MANVKLGVLGKRNFALLWIGQAISSLGDTTFSTVIILWVAVQIAKNQPWAPLAVSGALLATYIPAFLLGPIAGVLIDRWDKRRTMLCVDIIRAAIIALFLGVLQLITSADKTFAGLGLLVLVYLVTFALNSGSRFFRPAMLTLVGDIVEKSEQEQAMGLNQLSNSLAMIIGPPVATLLFFSVGAFWLLVINMISFIVSFISLYLMHVPPESQTVPQEQIESIFKEFNSGLSYILQQRLLVILFLSTIISMIGSGALNALDIFFLTQNLHAPQNLYGWLDTAFGIGLVVGSILFSIFAARIGKLRVIWLAQLLIGILVIAYARMTHFFPAALLLFFIGWPLAALSIVSGPFILQSVTRTFVGRVLSILDVVSTLAMVIGSFVSGLLASSVLQHFHTSIAGIAVSSIDTIMSGAGGLIFLSGCYTYFYVRRESPTITKAEAS